VVAPRQQRQRRRGRDAKAAKGDDDQLKLLRMLLAVFYRREPVLRSHCRTGLIGSGITFFGGTQIPDLQVLRLHARRAVQQR
jgi:hypothetical protein